MSNIKTAVDKVRNAGETFRAIVEIAEVLDGIGSIEQAEREANSRRDKAYKEADKAGEFLSEKQSELDEIAKKIDRLKDKARGELKDYESRGEEIVKLAEKKYMEIIESANNEKESIKKANRSSLLELQDLKGQIKGKHEELEKIEKHIVKLKTSVAGLIG